MYLIKPGTNIEEIIEAAWTIGKELEDSSKVRKRWCEIYYPTVLSFLRMMHFHFHITH